MWASDVIVRGFGSCQIDFDAALKMCSVFDADSSTSYVTSDGAVFGDFDAYPGTDIAEDLAINKQFRLL